MTTLELIIGGAVSLVTTGATGFGVWVRTRGALAVAQERAESAEAVAKVTADASVNVEAMRQVPRLIDDVRQLMLEKNECKETLHAFAMGRLQERADDAEACRQETARQVEAIATPLREQLARMATTAAEAREKDRGEDTTVTRLRDLAAEVRRSPTPPEPMAAQPEERRGELVPRKPATEIPPPPRGPKETR